ncbi:hypothetical protein ACX801_08035 [Arthrobacter bambusae]
MSSDPAAHRITTVEELDESASVVRFTVRAALTDAALPLLKIVRVHGKWHQGQQETQISNGRLAALVRERPTDYDRILSHVADRGRPKGARAVHELRAWLDANVAKAVASGWL